MSVINLGWLFSPMCNQIQFLGSRAQKQIRKGKRKENALEPFPRFKKIYIYLRAHFFSPRFGPFCKWNQRMLQRNRRLSLLLFTLLQRTWKCCWVISEKIPAPRPLNFLGEKEEVCFLVAPFKNVIYATHFKRFIYFFCIFMCVSMCVCVCLEYMYVYMCVSCVCHVQAHAPLRVHRRPLYSSCIPLILTQCLFLNVGLPFPHPGWNSASPSHPPVSAPHGTGAKGLHGTPSLCLEHWH